jgi:hypothetical protein
VRMCTTPWMTSKCWPQQSWSCSSCSSSSDKEQ